MPPAPGAGVSAVLAFAVGGVLAGGDAAPRLRWRRAGEGYDDARMATGEILGIDEGVVLGFRLPEARLDFLLLEPVAIPGRYRIDGLVFRGQAVADPQGRVITAVDDAEAVAGARGLVVSSRFDRPAFELDVRGLAADGGDDALRLVVLREAGPGAAAPTPVEGDGFHAAQAAIGRLGREVAALADGVSALAGVPAELAGLRAHDETSDERLAGVLAAQDRTLGAIEERLAAAVAGIAALERATDDLQARAGDLQTRTDDLQARADARHAAVMEALGGLQAHLDRVAHGVEKVFWRRWLRRLRGGAR
ncbi:MAG TPA: hypothetical protein VIG97_08230 [Luteimonas sp.]